MNYNRRPIFDGRNGADELSATLIVLGIVSYLAYPIFDNRIVQGCFVVAAIGLVALGIWRAFSRNIGKRRSENAAFVNFFHSSAEDRKARKETQKRAKEEEKARKAQRKEDLKTHVYYHCPHCGQELRVPRGKGKIRIKCPKCGEQFVKKT